MTRAHDEALMALDYAHVTASQVCTDLERAARAEAQDLRSFLRDIRAQLREIEQSLAEAQPFADDAFNQAP